MANPQKENGHVSVANDIWEALCRTDISGKHRRVFDTIVRKTWGWNKKEDAIPISQIVERTGISRRTVIYCLQDLEAKRMIFVKRGGDGMNRDINRMSINKDFEVWAVQNSAPQTEKNRSLAKVSSAKLRKSKGLQGGSAKLGKRAVQNYVEKVESFALSKDTTSKDTLSKDRGVVHAAPPPLALSVETKLSPKQETIEFFEKDKTPTIQYLVAHGVPEKIAIEETEKFVRYWTELNHSGKRQRWQTEKTFEVKRRFVTWMQRVSHNRRGFTAPQEPKGIEI